MAVNDTIPEPPIIELLIEQIEAMSPEDRRRVNEAAEAICNDKEKLALEQVSKKSTIESRALDDMRQYHGRYPTKTESQLDAANQSKVFANLTRPKTNAWSARIGDILFPTDDKNWSIGPTPVPEISNKLQDSRFDARRLAKQASMYGLLAFQATDAVYKAEMTAKEQEAARQAQPLAQTAVELQGIVDEAKAKAEAMQDEIDDQLTEAKYGEKARMSIKEMCKLGTAIMKAPLSKTRVRGKWQVIDNEWDLDLETDPRPDAQRVDFWDFFPDMNARTVDEAEFFFERHLMTKRDMRTLAKKPGFNRSIISQLLRTEPKSQAPNYLQNIREITGNQNVTLENRYIVWEYSGALTGQEIDSLARAMLDPKQAAEVIEATHDEDPLREQMVVLWFCDGKPLKIGPHPLDSGEPVYSVSCFVDDPTSIFGFGVPYLARNAQAIINAAWRLMMDNADMSVGPQVVINRNVLEPADGDWNLHGFKEWLWQLGKTLPPGSPDPFQIYQTNSNLQYLLEVIRLAMVFLDEEISLPLVAQGEQGAHIETAEGRGMLMNAANVIFRDAVRNWDDRITVPVLTRYYDWNMQHSGKEHIKGDMEVKARGSSVLLVRDQQTANLQLFLTQFGESQIYGPYIKHVDGLREVSKTMMLEHSKLVKSDEDIDAEEEERQNQPQTPSPEEIKLQIATMQAQSAQAVAQANLQGKMIDIATKSNVTLEKVGADLTAAMEKIKSAERLAAVDAALTQRQITIKASEPHPNISTTGTTQ